MEAAAPTAAIVMEVAAPTAAPAWKFTPIVTVDEDTYVVTFTIERDGLVVVINFFDPDSAAPEDWNALLEPGWHSLDFCTSNGNVSVSSSKGMITFEVSKHGAGGDGAITVTAPVAACRDAIEVVEKRVAEIRSARVE